MFNKLYLASKSPRRKELLAQMGIDFEVLHLDLPEEVKPSEDFRGYSTRICNEKADAAWAYVISNNLPLYPILTADTEVIYKGAILGKPLSYDDAFRMWQLFAGDSHTVITTITLYYKDFKKTLSRESLVFFDNLSDEEIHTYLKTGDYQDKSGSYGIQSYAGQFIKKIDGCFYSIMGLPLNAVRDLLSQLNKAYY